MAVRRRSNQRQRPTAPPRRGRPSATRAGPADSRQFVRRELDAGTHSLELSPAGVAWSVEVPTPRQNARGEHTWASLRYITIVLESSHSWSYRGWVLSSNCDWITALTIRSPDPSDYQHVSYSRAAVLSNGEAHSVRLSAGDVETENISRWSSLRSRLSDFWRSVASERSRDNGWQTLCCVCAKTATTLHFAVVCRSQATEIR